MATQPCPGIAEARFLMTADGQPVENVLHFYKGSGAHWTQAELDSLISALTTWFATYMVPLLPTTLTLQEIICTDLTDLQGLKVTEAITSGNVGTNGTQMLPLNVTKAIELFTGNRGRGVNGHFYWPALCENQVALDTVDGTVIDNMTEALDAIITAVNLGLPGITWVVLSRYLNGVKRGTGIGRQVTLTEAANAFVSTMKDRLPAHKRKRKHVTPAP